MFPTPSYKKFNKGLDKFDEIGDKYVSKYLSDIKASAAVSEKAHGMSLLEHWLIKGKMSQSEAVAHAISMLAFAVDTVSFEECELLIIIYYRLHFLQLFFFLSLLSILKFKRRHASS